VAAIRCSVPRRVAKEKTKSAKAKQADRQPSPTKHVAAPDLARLRNLLAEYVEAEGLRWTDKRRLICDTFFQSTEHIGLEELLSRVRAKDRRIGYATVYRTMRMLVQSGVAHERRFADGVTSYEPRDLDTHHDHLICLDCGKIVEFKDPRIEKLQDQLARAHGFEVRYHKHELYCVCLDEKCPGKRRKTPR
jgi:Fur family ferric uptake transcriptional regulator